MGAHQDTLRFRRDIAHDLNVRRHRVSGFMVGEHGLAMVPLWSTVHASPGNEIQDRACVTFETVTAEPGLGKLQTPIYLRQDEQVTFSQGESNLIIILAKRYGVLSTGVEKFANLTQRPAFAPCQFLLNGLPDLVLDIRVQIKIV